MFNSQVSLSTTIFVGNSFSGTSRGGRDVYISDRFASPFVDCDDAATVAFCDGLDEDTIAQFEDVNSVSTDCGDKGLPGGDSCIAYWEQ